MALDVAGLVGVEGVEGVLELFGGDGQRGLKTAHIGMANDNKIKAGST